MDSSSTEESFLTVAEVAELLKLNQQTVRNWIDQGKLPALRVGRRVRIRKSDFERVIAEAELKRAARDRSRPSAEDFWGGDLVLMPEAPRDGDASSGEDAERPRVHDPPAPAPLAPDNTLAPP